MGHAEDFRSARVGLRLELAAMADALDIEPETLDAIERGSLKPSGQVRLRLRRLLGLRSLAREPLEESPVAALFRSASPETAPQVTSDLAYDGSLVTFGDFVSSRRDLAWLDGMLDDVPSLDWLEAFQPLPVPPSLIPAVHGRELAAETRRVLDRVAGLSLGTRPIPTMLGLLETLGVDVVWVTPESLTADIEGASIAVPGLAILVNPIGGSDMWWHTRMTLAHELCHLLYDRDWLGHEHTFAMLSPRRPAKVDELEESKPMLRRSTRTTLWAAFDELTSREQRANAFAAYFLVPPPALHNTIAGCDPRSDEAILEVVRQFGVGWDTAATLLKHCCKLSEDDRRAMLRRGRTFQPPTSTFHDDAPTCPPLPRRGRLLGLVARGLREEVIDEIDARVLLDLTLADPLPDELDMAPAMREPVIIPETHALKQADLVLWQQFPDRDLRPCRPRRGPDGWEFDVVERGTDGPVLGRLKLADDFDVLELPQPPARPTS